MVEAFFKDHARFLSALKPLKANLPWRLLHNDAYLAGFMKACLDHDILLKDKHPTFLDGPLIVQFSRAQTSLRVEAGDSRLHLGICSKWGFVGTLAAQLISRVAM